MTVAKIFWCGLGLLAFVAAYDAILAPLPFDAALVVLILAAVATSSWKTAALWTALLGIFLDGSVPLPQGVLLFSLTLTLFGLLALVHFFFPHGSLLSTVFLSGVATILFFAAKGSLIFLVRWIGADFYAPAFPAAGIFLARLAWNVAACATGFLLVRVVSRRLHSSFLSVRRETNIFWRA